MYTPFDLTGKVALITGGNGGIGLGFAEAIAQAGGDVCIWGTNAEKNASALDAIRKHGGKAEALICDVSDSAAVDKAFAETLETFGRVDGAFANAGVSGRGIKSVTEITDDEWHRVLGVNLDGAFYTLRRAAAHMIERAKAGDPGGRLVGTASLAALSGAARNEHYAATKGGLVSVLRAMASELARFGITANAVLPGWIETEMTEDNFHWDKFAEAVLPRVPLRRWGTPADFGGIAVYLMSEASAYHTGDSLLIDGGYWIF
jgi:NAD(P)-dependent dehydrogenase (short-subunit alcohol dehydrogenase family)